MHIQIQTMSGCRKGKPS